MKKPKGYMKKSLINKIFMKHQLYTLRTRDQYLDKIVMGLKNIDIKVKKDQELFRSVPYLPRMIPS